MAPIVHRSPVRASAGDPRVDIRRSSRSAASRSTPRASSPVGFPAGIGAPGLRDPVSWRPSRSRAGQGAPRSTSGRPTTAASTARSMARRTSATVRRQVARSLSLDHDGRELGGGRTARPGPRRGPGALRLAPAGLLLLRVRGGDLVRHRSAHLDAPGARRQGPAGRIAGRRDRGRRDRSCARSRGRNGCSRRPTSRPQLGQGRPPPRPGPGRHRRAPRHGAAARAPRSRRPGRA